MPLAKTWNNTGYSIPQAGEINWAALTNFLADLADNAQTTIFQKMAVRVATTSPVTVSAATDCIVISNLGVAGPVTVNLPAGVTKQIFTIVDGKGDAATNNITIVPASGNINGAANYVMSINNGGISIVYDGTQWTVFNEFTGVTEDSGYIERSEIAAGTADHVIINDGSGFLSSEAQLASTRGGTGVSNAGTLTYGANNLTFTTSGVTSLTLPTTGTVATLAGTETLSAKTLVTPLISGGSIDVTAAGALAIGASVGANNLTLGGATSTVVIPGNIEVQGTTTTLNTATVDSEDKNITVNKGGNDATSEGAGLTVERTGTAGSFIYANAAASKWKIGALGAEIEVADISSSQTFSGKTISGASNTITNVSLTTSVTGILPSANGGTGVNNAGSLTYGANNVTFTTSGVTSLTLPTSGTVLSNDNTILVQNKSLEDSTTSIVDNADNTKILKFQVSTITTGTTRTLTVPNADTTIVGTDVAQVITAKDIDGGTASNTSRITLPKASTATLTGLTRKEGTIVYDTDLDKPFFDNGTTLTAFGTGGGSGSGEINMVTNGSAETDVTTGWTAGASHSAARETGSANPLTPVTTASFAISSSSAVSSSNTAGYYYTISTVPTGLRNKKLKLEFYVNTPSSANGEWSISVYSGATRMVMSTDSSGATVLPSSFIGKFTTYIDTDSSTSYTVHFFQSNRSASNTLYVTGIIFGPGIQPQGAVVGEWQTFTPTGTWSTNTTYSGFYRRVGSSMEMTVRVLTSGAPDATSLYINLPSGFTIDTSKVLNTGSFQTDMGWARFEDAGTAYYSGRVSYQSSSSVAVNYLDDTAAGLGVSSVSQTSPFIWASGDEVIVQCFLPIAEWAGSGTINVAQNDVEYAWNSNTTANTDDSTSFGYGPSGVAFAAHTSERYRTVQFQTPIQPTDSISIEINSASAGDPDLWIPLIDVNYDTGIRSYTTQASTAYGMGFRFSTTTDSTLRVYFAPYMNVGASYGLAGSAWSGAANYKWRVKKSKGGQAVGFGLATTTSAGLVNPYTVGSGVVYAGTYTPTITNGTNVTSTTPAVCMYYRIGSLVTVSGQFTLDSVSSSLVASDLTMTLPIASDLTATTDLSGTAVQITTPTLLYAPMCIFADTSGNKALFSWNSNDGASNLVTFTFTYRII